MTCKDCYHYEACKEKFAGLKKLCVDKPKKHTELDPRVENRCQQFKDQSLIVELPCKVGDEAYYLTYKSYNPLSYKVAKAKVIKFYINRSGIFDIKFQALKSNFTFRLPICKVFFDKSEAEAKLKELNNER